MAFVRMVEVAAHKIVDVTAMRHRLMAAAGSMHMVWLVARAGVRGRAGIRVPRGDLQHALIDVVAVHGVQAPVVEVVDMIAVADGGVPASLAVDVRVLRMDLVLRHGQPSVISELRGKG